MLEARARPISSSGLYQQCLPEASKKIDLGGRDPGTDSAISRTSSLDVQPSFRWFLEAQAVAALPHAAPIAHMKWIVQFLPKKVLCDSAD
jgi:hypothetical protein